MTSDFDKYAERLTDVLRATDWQHVSQLAQDLYQLWKSGRQLFICGNGGSAGNAVHLANDFLYGIGKNERRGMKVEALSANTSVLTCLANDIGYDEIFSEQLRVKAQTGDMLIVLSGSGASPNIIRALEVGKEMELSSYAILGYSGGRCKELADKSIHFPIDDMQISEDLQLVVGHMCMQWLYKVGLEHSKEE